MAGMLGLFWSRFATLDCRCRQIVPVRGIGVARVFAALPVTGIRKAMSRYRSTAPPDPFMNSGIVLAAKRSKERRAWSAVNTDPSATGPATASQHRLA
jgi:hypothetical protein